MRDWWNDVRQWFFPMPYRINSYDLGLRTLSSQLDEFLLFYEAQTNQTPPGVFGDREICSICTNLWRIDEKLQALDAGSSSEKLGLATRHLEAIWDALRKTGFEVFDHTGDRVPDVGVFGLREVAFEKQKGLLQRVVIETIKPTITYENEVIQLGEVIVGVPEED